MSEFQMALLFPFVPVAAFLIVELILDIINNGGDDDDDQDGGKGIRIMEPAYVPASNPI